MPDQEREMQAQIVRDNQRLDETVAEAGPVQDGGTIASAPSERQIEGALTALRANNLRAAGLAPNAETTALNVGQNMRLNGIGGGMSVDQDVGGLPTPPNNAQSAALVYERAQAARQTAIAGTNDQ